MFTLSFMFVFFIISIGETSFVIGPDKKCVPTAKMMSACYICLCGSDGIFACYALSQCMPEESRQNASLYFIQSKEIQYTSRLIRVDRIEKSVGHDSIEMECMPNRWYLEKLVICTCDSNGQWSIPSCRKKFGTFIFDTDTRRMLNVTVFRSAVTCQPNKTYLINCNICQCDAKGFFQTDTCTRRTCRHGHKADDCKIGDFLRTEGEICICSEINLYIDNFCLPVLKTKTQMLYDTDLDAITNILDMNVNEESSYRKRRCKRLSTYRVDNAECFCYSNGSLSCRQPIHKATRSGKGIPELYPEVMREDQRCVPHRTYQIVCNTCTCLFNRVLKCSHYNCTDDYPMVLLSMPYAYNEEKSNGMELVVI